MLYKQQFSNQMKEPFVHPEVRFLKNKYSLKDSKKTHDPGGSPPYAFHVGGCFKAPGSKDLASDIALQCHLHFLLPELKNWCVLQGVVK